MKRVAAVGVIVAAASLACGKAAVCPTLPAVPAERPPVPTAVTLDSCEGTKGECGRAEQVRAEIERVINAPEFECLVTRFDQDHAIGQLGTETLIDDCGALPPPPAPSSLSGYRESRCNAPAITNEDVYRLFRASPADCDGRALGVVHLDIEFSGSPAGMANTERAPRAKTVTKDHWYDGAKNYEVAAVWIHEQTHRVGFCDLGDEQYSTILVPYVYGFAGCLVAARQDEGNTKPLSAYRAACQPMLGPAFRP